VQARRQAEKTGLGGCAEGDLAMKSLTYRLPDLAGKYNGTFQRAALVFIFPLIFAKGHRFSRATPAVNH